MFHTRNCVLKILKLFGQLFGLVFEYMNTIWGAKKPNTKYQILFGIEKIQIHNINTSIQSDYSMNILILNFLSHPGIGIQIDNIKI